MKYTKILGPIALSALLLGMTGCGSSDNDPIVPETPVAVDIPAISSKLNKAYVPSLFYSNVPTINESFAMSTNAAFETFKEAWEIYKSSVGTTYNGDDLSTYIANVDTEIDLADNVLKDVLASNTYPANISAAHEALEAVRDILGTMRQDISINYFMDHVTEAHHAMEPVAGAASKYTAGDITLEQLCTNLNNALPTFSTSWESLHGEYNQAAIADLYDLSTPKSTNMNNNINGMSGILTNLSAALPGCTEAVATEANKIKPVFVKMFLGFGDFITPFEDKMIAMEKGIVSGLYCTNNPPDVVPTCGGLDGSKTLINGFDILSKDFQAQYPVIPNKLNLPGVIYWSSYFTTIKNAVDHAKSVASSALTTEDLVDAHEDFETIRVAMYDLRSTYENFAFVMDRVTDYHSAMGPIAGAVKSMNDPAQITQGTIDTITAVLPKAKSTMLAMKASVSSMDVATFGFDDAWHTAQMGSVTSQSKNLSDLELALNENNSSAILEYAQMVKPKFVGFFKAFGAF